MNQQEEETQAYGCLVLIAAAFLVIGFVLGALTGAA